MTRKEKEHLEKVHQARLRGADVVFQKIQNTRNLITSYLEDAEEELALQAQALATDSKFSAYDSLPTSYWKGRQSLAVELLARLDHHNKDIREILDLLV